MRTEEKIKKIKFIVRTTMFIALVVLGIWVSNVEVKAAKQLCTCRNPRKFEIIIEPATCKQKGKGLYHCSLCDLDMEAKSHVIPIADHKWSIFHYATCCDDSYVECEYCHTTKTNQYTATGAHSKADRVVVEATCTHGGEIERYCQNTGKTLGISYTDPTEHQWETIKERTCVNNEKQKCKNCPETNIVYNQITDHTPDPIIISEPTCTESGYKKYYCFKCNVTVQDNVEIQPDGHEMEKIKDATCVKGEEWKCKNCSESEIKGNRITTHNPTKKVIKEETCYEDGCWQYYCEICRVVVEDNVKILATNDHKFTIITKYPTCISEGEKQCKNCPTTCPIDKITTHTPSSRVIEPNDCEKGGTNEIYCPICNVVISKSPTAPKGHEYRNGVCRHCKKPCTHEFLASGDCKYCDIVQDGGPSRKATEKKETNVETVKDADPINTFSGAHEIDIAVMKLGGVSGLNLSLSYKSDKAVSGLFGRGFAYNYESFIGGPSGSSIEELAVYHSPSYYVTYELIEQKDVANDVGYEWTTFYHSEAVGNETDELTKTVDGPFILKSHGKTYTFDVYAPECRLVSVTEKTGETVNITYNEDSIDISDAASGQTISLILNDKGLVSEVNNYLSGGTLKATFTYDENGCLTGYTDLEGYTTVYDYDDTCRIISATDADGNTYFTDTFDENGRVCEQRDAEGNVTYFTYEDDEEYYRTTTVTDREGAVKTYRFTPEGRLIQETDALGNVSTREYDDRGNVIKTTDGLGNVSTFTYDERGNLTRSEDALGNVNTYIYDDRDNLLSLTNADGETIHYVYDERNRLVSSTDLRGLTTTYEYNDNSQLVRTKAQDRVITYGYDNAGNLESVTDPYGNTSYTMADENDHVVATMNPDGGYIYSEVDAYGETIYSEDSYGNVSYIDRNCMGKPVLVTDALGNKAATSYDSRQLLSSVTDSNGNTTGYYYGREERLIKTVYADGSFVTSEYDGAGQQTATTDAEGNKTTFVYDANGNITDKTFADGTGERYTYNSVGLVSDYTDSKGYTSHYTYDAMGRVLTLTDGNGGVTTYTYSGSGDLLATTDPEGNTVSYTYDIYGRNTSVTDAMGNTTRYEYDLNGNLIKITDALGTVTEYTYDACNRLVAESTTAMLNGTRQTRTIIYTYDLNGRLTATTDPYGRTSHIEYDAIGNVVKATDSTDNETTYSYDANGNRISTTDAPGNTTTTTVDEMNRAVSTTAALGLITTYTYDKNGRMISSTDPMGGVSTADYDSNGNLLMMTGPEGAETIFTYDEGGNVSSRSTTEGESVKYTYNALDLVSAFENARGEGFTYSYDRSGRIRETVTPEGTITYTFDANGNVLTETTTRNENPYGEDPGKGSVPGTITRTYDALNRVTSVTDTSGHTVSYTYDGFGNISKITYPDGTEVSYTYDLVGDILTVTDFEGNVTSYTYDELYREKETLKPNGTKTEKKYDAVGNLIHLTERGINSEILSDTSYVYDADYRLISETETVAGYRYEYTYDDLGRCTMRITYDLRTGEYTEAENFDYDGAGNIEDAEGHSADGTSLYENSYDYNSKDNTFASSEGKIFTYDKDGNLIEGYIDGRQTSLQYDSRNRLIGYEGKNGERSLYSYDCEDYRVSGVLTDGETYHIRLYCYDRKNRNLLVTYGSDGTVEKYVYGNGLISSYAEIPYTEGSESGEPGDEDQGGDVQDTDNPGENNPGEGESGNENTDPGAGGDNTDPADPVTPAEPEYIEEDVPLIWLFWWGVDDMGELSNDTEFENSYLSEPVDVIKDAFYSYESGYRSTFRPRVMVYYFGDEYYIDYDGFLSEGTTDGPVDIHLPEGTTYFRIWLKDAPQNIAPKIRDNFVLHVRRPVIRQTEEPSTESGDGTENTGTEGTDGESSDDADSGTDEGDGDDGDPDPGEVVYTTVTTDITPGWNFSWGINKYGKVGESTAYKTTVLSDEISIEEGAVYTYESTYSHKSRPQLYLYYFSEEGLPVKSELIYQGTTTEPVELPMKEGATSFRIYLVSVPVAIEDTIVGGVSLQVTRTVPVSDAGLNAAASFMSLEESDLLAEFSAESIEALNVGAWSEATENIDAQGIADPANIASVSDQNNDADSISDSGIAEANNETDTGIPASDISEESEHPEPVILIKKEWKYYSYDLRGSVTRVTDENGATTARYSYSTYGRRTTIEGSDSEVFGYCGRDGVLTETNGLLYMRARYYSPELMRFINQDIVVGDISNSTSLSRYSYVNGNPVTNIDPFGLEYTPINGTDGIGSLFKPKNTIVETAGKNPVFGLEIGALAFLSSKIAIVNGWLISKASLGVEGLSSYYKKKATSLLAKEYVGGIYDVPIIGQAYAWEFSTVDSALAYVYETNAKGYGNLDSWIAEGSDWCYQQSQEMDTLVQEILDGLDGSLNSGFNEYDIVPYNNQKFRTIGFEKHHGFLNEWAEHNIPGYTKKNAPTILLSPEKHEYTKEVYREWLRKNYGSPVGVSPDWSSISKDEAMRLTIEMFDAARVPQNVRAEYFELFDIFITGG